MLAGLAPGFVVIVNFWYLGGGQTESSIEAIHCLVIPYLQPNMSAKADKKQILDDGKKRRKKSPHWFQKHLYLLELNGELIDQLFNPLIN